MGKSLVIVESPAKAKTINKYLGRNYTVKASYGHVMDLPKKYIGILLPADGAPKSKAKRKKKGKAGEDPKADKKAIQTIANNPEEEFEPTYEVIPGKIKVISELKKAAESAENVYLAT